MRRSDCAERHEMRGDCYRLRSTGCHGQVTALSEVLETDTGRSIVLVGSLSRMYVCEVCGDVEEGGQRVGEPRGEEWTSESRSPVVLAVRDGILPTGTAVHGIVVRRASEMNVSTDSFGQDGSRFHVVAYGGRYVALMLLEVATLDGSVFLEARCVRAFQKWVLAADALCVTCDRADETLFLAVGMIDNSVEVCRVALVERGDNVGQTGSNAMTWSLGSLGRRHGTRRCMLYSMDIFGSVVLGEGGRGYVYDIRVAGGTVLFDVVTWRFGVHLDRDRESDGTCTVDDTCAAVDMSDVTLARVDAPMTASTVFCGGHTGSVHCVAWDARGNMVASGSDDRTVRVWLAPWSDSFGTEEVENQGKELQKRQERGESSFVFRQEARVWSLRFSASEGNVDVYSGLENGIVACWSVVDSRGNRGGTHDTVCIDEAGVVPLARWGCGKGVRVIQAWNGVVLTGGMDGSVRAWDAYGGKGSTVAAMMVLGPFSENVGGEPEPARTATVEALSERRNFMGSSFEAIKVMRLVADGRVLLVATDKGRLVAVDMDSTAHRQWVVYTTGSASRPFANIRAYSTEREVIISCCDVRGALYLFRYDQAIRQGGSGPEEMAVAMGNREPLVLADKSRMIDSFFAVHDKQIILVCVTSSGALELKYVRKGALLPICTVPSPLGSRVTALAWMELQTLSRDDPTSLSSKLPVTLLMMGSAKGGVAAWTLSGVGNGNGTVGLSLLACHTRGHGGTPVQTITIHATGMNKVDIQTTAMDFCVLHYSLDVASGAFPRRNEVRLEAVKTICQVMSTSDRDMVAGFFANRMILWDRKLEVQVCEFPSGGWKRPWAMHVDDGVIFCYTSGVGDIHVFRRRLRNHNPREIIPACHGREINSVVDLGGLGTAGKSLLVTAGADVRLFASRWRRDILEAQCISTQPFGTSTRVLRALPLTTESTVIVSGGARSIMTAWRAFVAGNAGANVGRVISVGDRRSSDGDNWRIEYLSAFANPAVCGQDGLKSEASMDTVDMRVTAIALASSTQLNIQPIHTDRGNNVLVAIALSTGEMELRHIPWTHTHRKLHDWPLVARTQSTYPVLSLAIVDSTVWAGTTNGDLIAWNPQNGKTDMYPAIHACGVNTMASFAPPEASQATSRAIVTGGDDQSISIFCLDALEQRHVVPNAHASAIKDMCFLPDPSHAPLLCTIGLDQYLRVWKISDQLTLTCLGSTHLQVQEPAACCIGSDSTLTVVGRGIERIHIAVT